jgi:hypothetical protein
MVNNGGGILSVSGAGTTVATGNGVLLMYLGPEGTGTSTIAGTLVQATAGGTLVTGSTTTLVDFTGGTHSWATNPGAAVFNVAGVNTAAEEVDLGGTLGTVEVTVGTDRPIRGAGVCPGDCAVEASLLKTNSTTVNIGGNVVKVDTAMLEASLPFLNLIGSTLTMEADAINLASMAKVVVGAGAGAAIKLNGTTMTVNIGALVNVAGGSYLNILANLLELSNSSILRLNDVNDGFLVKATGNSVVVVDGALIKFAEAAGNTVEIKNNSAPTEVINGIGFHFTGGATSANVEVLGTPINNHGTNVIDLVNGGSHILVEGTAKVKINGAAH